MKSPAQFVDVKAILDAIPDGGRYRLPTPGSALHWRQRAYQLREMLRQVDAASMANVQGYVPQTIYDAFILRIDKDDPCVVVIETRQAKGELTDLEGNLIRPATFADPLLEEAHELVGKLSNLDV